MSAMHDWGDGSAWLYALSFGVFGMAWASVAAVVAQLTQSARSANSMLALFIGASFLIRGIGDFLATAGNGGLAEPGFLTYLSPFGWLEMARSLTAPNFALLLPPLICIVLVIPLAFFLLSRRDVGAGILPARTGRARASKLLKTPVGLTLYLQKNVFIGWLVGSLAMAAVIGVLTPNMADVYDVSPSAKDMIQALGGAGAMIPSLLSAMIAITAFFVVAYAIQAISRLRGEEVSRHLESLLATGFGRIKWLVLHVVFVAVGATIILVLSSGLMGGLAALGGADLSFNIGDFLLAGLSYMPMILVFIDAYVVLFGILPQIAAALAWIYAGFMFFVSWIGPMLNLPDWAMQLSLTSHIASVPAEAMKTVPLIIMLTFAICALAFGVFCWRNRNIASE
jgi:ABC-2 type transport system permease protein